MASEKGKEDNRSLEDLRRDIYGTRQKIDHDINVLEERFRPGGMIDRAANYLKDEARRNQIYKTVQAHPLCAALSAASLASAAAGFAWMRAVGPERREGQMEGLRRFGRKAKEWASDVRGRAKLAKDKAKSKLMGAKSTLEQTQAKFEDVGPTASERLAQARQSAKETVNEYGQKIQETGQKVQEKARVAGERIRRQGRELRDSFNANPLPYAVGAIALGLLLGELLPKLRSEDRLMGKTKEKLGVEPEPQEKTQEQPTQTQEAQPTPQGAGQPEAERTMDQPQEQPQDLTPQVAC